MGGLLELHDDVEDVIRDGAVVPSEDGKVLLYPINVGGVGVGAVDMSEQTKLAKHGGEEGTPFGVVGSFEIKHNRNVCLDACDVDIMSHRRHGGGGRWSSDSGKKRWS